MSKMINAMGHPCRARVRGLWGTGGEGEGGLLRAGCMALQKCASQSWALKTPCLQDSFPQAAHRAAGLQGPFLGDTGLLPSSSDPRGPRGLAQLTESCLHVCVPPSLPAFLPLTSSGPHPRASLPLPAPTSFPPNELLLTHLSPG